MSSNSSSQPCDPGPSGQLPNGTPCYTQENIDCLQVIRDEAYVTWQEKLADAQVAEEAFNEAQHNLDTALEDQCPPQSSSSSSSNAP